MSISFGPRGRSIVVLTGAGISRESGIETFRDGDGLWARHRIEDVATPEGYERNPQLVQSFYNDRRRQLSTVVPNAAHEALARLERAWTDEVLVVTQNVDDLHDRAGSRKLIHMHGELLKVRCEACRHVYVSSDDVTIDTSCPSCATTGLVRPHIVWFGEMPLEMETIYRTLDQCGMFISIGTSGNVYPAAQFVEIARAARACTVELNLEPSLGASKFALRRYGPATRVVRAFVDELLATLSVTPKIVPDASRT
ncbi:MAG TPA: NAD-dependent protein deacylase [Candidatus Ozemobacteraceae bacterium]|nr:NAD-dependent protein deacylase [Candidatus Ozemobacteraceae bacterium]